MTLPWMAAKILLRPVAELRPHAGNARVHSAEQLEQIKASMLAFGFTNRLLVDEDGVLIAGHGRLTDEGLRAIGINTNEGDAMPDTARTVAPDAEPRKGPAPIAKAAQAAPLTEETAMLDQALATHAAKPRASLRDTAAAILAAWDDQAARRFGTHDGDLIGALESPMAALRTLLAGKAARAPREPGAPRKPRQGTKQE